MATQTSVLGLSKPAGNENALVSVLNSDMDLIDAEAGKVRGNIAATYSDSSSYAVGDLCIYNGILYKCNTAIGSGGETWNASHWTQITIDGELTALNGKIANVQITSNELITEETLTGYSSLADLQINDDALYCIECSNDSSSETNIIVDFETKNLIPIWGFNYLNAPQYAKVMSPILFLKAGKYKLRATGTIKLRKYVYRT